MAQTDLYCLGSTDCKSRTQVTVASLSASLTVTGRNGIKVVADTDLDQALQRVRV